jgi:dCTP deaminase
MILTDREIKNSLASGLISIDPPPAADAFDSTTVDLTLDNTLRIFKKHAPGLSVAVDPGTPGYKAQALILGVTDPFQLPDDGWDLQPGPLVLGWTRETVELKMHGRLAGRVEGKSGLARIGLGIHVTAPIIHTGFRGTIQLEIINHGPMPIRLRPRLPICQLVFELTLGMPDKAYEGQFLGQSAT